MKPGQNHRYNAPSATPDRLAELERLRELGLRALAEALAPMTAAMIHDWAVEGVERRRARRKPHLTVALRLCRGQQAAQVIYPTRKPAA